MRAGRRSREVGDATDMYLAEIGRSQLLTAEEERELTAEAELDKTYMGRVVRVVSFGAFIEILPGVEGLLHISEYDWRRIEKIEDVVKVGDKFDVKLIDIDEKNGNLKLSRKALLERPPRDPNQQNDQRRDQRRDRPHGHRRDQRD